MYEHAIPQNIMEYEFKLFAGLTLKQFIYVAVSGGLSFALYELNRLGAFPAFFAWLTIPTVMLVGITLGLGSYNKRTMEDWLTSYTRASNIILRRVWKKDTAAVKYENFFTTKPESFPIYLTHYLLTRDEAKLLIDQSNATQNPGVVFQSAIPDPTISEVISITPESVHDYADTGTNNLSVANTVAFILRESELPLEGVVAYFKDANSSVVGSLRSNKDGIIYFDRPFHNGEYEVEFQSPEADTFPKIKISLQGTTYPLINISPTS